MLNELSIKNYTLIDELLVKFDTGLTIITGETGAGKSILLGGLSLALGKRADLSTLKRSTKKCIIEATFDISTHQLTSFFEHNDIDYEDETLIRREILPSGKSRAFVNDTPVKLHVLAELGSRLIDVHSQHQNLDLTDNVFQYQVIDALAQNSEYYNSYCDLLNSYKSLEDRFEELKALKQQSEADHDYQCFLLNELQAANLDSIQLSDLEAQFDTLTNVELIQNELSRAQHLLEVEDAGVLPVLRAVHQLLAKLSGYSNRFERLSSRVESVQIELDDIFNDIQLEHSQTESDPERLHQVEATLELVRKLLSKHQVSDVEALKAIKLNLIEKTQALVSLDDSINAVQSDISQTKTQLHSLAQTLSKRRQQVIPELKSELEAILNALGMPNARFNFQLQHTEVFGTYGSDQLEFQFSANKGGEFKPLKKAASGGELSRIMLAIKSILVNHHALPTIVFDEIDTGVSGEIATKMASIMNNMGQHMQVFSITHLPQIAAKGQHHFKVYKTDKQGVTVTKMKRLDHEERIKEIAQMLGGNDISASAKAHAIQLLN